MAIWRRDCQQCQRGKVHQLSVAPVQVIPIPAHRLNHVHMDPMGPLPPSPRGHMFLLTYIDRSTRWVGVMPLKNIKVDMSCKDGFVARWGSCFDTPGNCHHRQETQFKSSRWQYICNQLNIQDAPTISFRLQSNGMVEKGNRQITEAYVCNRRGDLKFKSHQQHLSKVKPFKPNHFQPLRARARVPLSYNAGQLQNIYSRKLHI